MDDNDTAQDGDGKLDTSTDLLEQQQAMEQARLLHRFRELRQWQLQQQEQLMHQQKTQLEVLRQEQMKVQTFLTKEREMQWGGVKVIRQQAGLTPTKTPPRRRPPNPASHDPVRMSKAGSEDPLALTLDQPMSTAETSLPIPVMYGSPTPFLDDTSTNPELFSNPESQSDYQADVDAEDGVCPIPDSASEMSVGSYSHQVKKNFIKSQPFLGDMASDTVSIMSDGSYIPPRQPPPRQNGNHVAMPPEEKSKETAMLLQTLLQATNTDTLKQMLGLVTTEQIVIPNQPRSMKAGVSRRSPQREVSRRSPQREVSSRSSPPRDYNQSAWNDVNENNSTQQHSQFYDMESREFPRGDNTNQNRLDYRSHQDLRHGGDHEAQRHGREHLHRHSSERQHDKKMSPRRVPLEGHGDLANGLAEEYTIEEDSLLEQSDVQDVTVEEVKDSRLLGIDDRPIKGVAGKKTFEQLLEEQFQQEKERLEAEELDTPSKKKKPFLRKGHGLSRFAGGRRRTPPKRPTANKNHSDKKVISEPKPVIKTKQTKPVKKSKQASSTVLHKPGGDQQPPSTKHSQKQLSPRGKSRGKSKSSSSQPSKHSTSAQPESPSHRTSRHTDSVPYDDDASFVAKIKKIEEHKKVEENELEVFELLEDFADNVSFCSNSSVVSRLMKHGRDQDTENVKAVIEAKKSEKDQRSMEREVNRMVRETGIQTCRQEPGRDTSLIDAVDLETSSDTLTDSSSSDSSSDEDVVLTPKTRRSGDLDNGDVDHEYEALFEESQKAGFVFVNKGRNNRDAFRSSDSEVRSSSSLSPTKSLTRKIASKDSSYDSSDTQSILKRLAANADELTGKLRASTQVADSGNSETRAFVNEMFGGSKSGGGADSEEDVGGGEDSDNSVTKLKEKLSGDTENRVTPLAFDDEDEWTVTAPQTQIAKMDSQSAMAEDKHAGTPPTSRLVARLFPQLKNAQQAKHAQKIEQDEHKLQTVMQTVVGDGIQSKLLRDKLAELEKEIEKFRNENANLEKLRREREESLSKLKQEITNFEQEKDEEMKRLEEFRSQEMKKLKHERKLFEQYQKTVRSMPDKRDREEIDALKHQLSELQEEVKKKEGRWTSASNRLRQRLEVVDMENQELKEEVKLLERRHLEVLQRDSQRKNGVQKSFPRSSTPNEELERGKRSDSSARGSASSHDMLTKPNPNTTANSFQSKHSQHSLSLLHPDPAQGHTHNVSGDAIPRGVPTAPISLPGSDNQVPEEDTSSVGAVVNVPRKQSSKFSSENPSIDKGDKQHEETQYPDGKVERTYTNGAREILFANGTRKEISSDGQSIVVSFFNGDIKQIFPDQRVVYFYADAQTTHTTYPDGLEILQFQNNQIEKHYPDGTNEITFPDQTIKYLFPNGSEESIFPDGTVIRVEKSGDKTMEFPNGQREIHTDAFKRREYPDGTVKTVYPDGRQETRYSTGRIRLKDKDGNVIVDRMC